MNQQQPSPRIAYLGPSGAGLGFQLAGMDVIEFEGSNDMLEQLRALVGGGEYGIIFVDEGMAENVYEDVQKLNEQTVPAIVLLADPTSARHLAARKMDTLIVKAVGSDILMNN